MKVLSDNTADRLLRHLDAADGGNTPRRIPRGASTTPPARMWQIHVVPSTGVVTVDGGDVYADGTRYTLAASSLGTASANMYVVWQNGTGGGSVSLVAGVSGLSDPFRVIGGVVLDHATSTFSSRQYIGEPIEVGGGVNPGPDSDAVAKVLGGTDYNAATDEWRYGEIDQVTGKPTYPVFNPTRLYWWEAQHKLLCFRRTMTYNSSGLLVAVSEERLDPTPSVFTTVAEMP